jgi:hypothetical protein
MSVSHVLAGNSAITPLIVLPVDDVDRPNKIQLGTQIQLEKLQALKGLAWAWA